MSKKYIPIKSKSKHPVLRALCTPFRRLRAWVENPTSRIFALRTLVTLSLVVAAAIVGTLAYKILSGNERSYAASQYDSITTQGLTAMVEKFSRMNTGTLFMAKLYGYSFPELDSWPNVALPGFFDMAYDQAKVSSLDNIVFMPFITDQTQLANFTDFAYNYWASEPALPPGTGYSPAGRGIWAIGPTGFYVDATGDTILYPSANPQHTWSVPVQISFSDDLPSVVLGYNTHSNPLFGPAQDTVQSCVAASANISQAATQCGFLSGTIPLPAPIPPPESPVPLTGYQSFIVQPILVEDPNASGKAVMVGTLSGMINWKTLLRRTVPSYVDGIDCVVAVGDSTFTYSIVEGEPIFQGDKDTHDQDYNHYARAVDLLAETRVGSFTPYTLTFYPTKSFFNAYTTHSPLYTTIGGVGIILFCSLVFTLYDVSMRRESTRKEVVLDTKRRFVRFISHEIRTPLNTVRLGLKLLEMELTGLSNQLQTAAASELPALVKDYVESWLQLADDVLGNSDSAVDVLNDLLNYDKIEMGTLRLEFSSVEIWSLVKKTSAAFVMQAKQKSIDVQLVSECWSTSTTSEQRRNYDALRVVGDNMRIAQVLRNLISNALKFTPEQGKVVIAATWDSAGLPDVAIKVDKDQAALLEEPRAGSIRVSVTDSGAGLSPDQLAQICSEGVQFNANQLQAGGGSGLGLFISKGLVEAHGGTLTVTSEGLGKGATFTMELPLFRFEDDATAIGDSIRLKPLPSPRTAVRSASGRQVLPESSPASGKSTAHKERMGSVNPAGPRRVLVIDDADSNRKLLMRVLTAKGFTCEGAANGQEGVDRFCELQGRGDLVDAILMDFEMPVLDGPGATHKLRELGCECLIVGVTGNVLPQDIDHFKEQGANTVLAKPLNIEAFESFLRAFRPARRTVTQVPTPAAAAGNPNAHELA